MFHRLPNFLGQPEHHGVRSQLNRLLDRRNVADICAELTHEMLQKYMRAFASIHGVNSNDENPRVSYNTRVELVEKHFREDGSEHGWTITFKTLARTGLNSYEVTWRQEVRGSSEWYMQ